MTVSRYEPSLTMREARAQYFAANRFAADGGYSDAWVDFKLGPIPFPFPNTAPRIRAVRVHDLHHVITGYATDFRGELEISAWEIGAGCKDFVAAWYLNLGGMGAGLYLAPRRSLAAFARGRRSKSLYGRVVETMLEETVGSLRRETGVDAAPAPATATDLALFALASLVGLGVGVVLFWIGIVLLPFGLLTALARKVLAR